MAAIQLPRSPQPGMQNGQAVAGPSVSAAQAAMSRLSASFPDADSLSRHQQIHARLQLEILDAKDEIARLKAELRRDQDPDKMSRIQSQIGALMLQINVIREKAQEAEAIVKAITSDIQRLDVAKRNLTGAIQTLERWGMLQSAHRQLKELIPSGKFRDISQALAAVTQLLGPLRPLTTIPVVAEVFKAAEEDRKKVQEKVAVEMDAFFKQDPNKPVDLEVIADVCLVIDVLGGDFKNHMIERYLTLKLSEYRRIFRSTDEAGQLDNVPRRYAWFRRVLKQHDEDDARLFPDSWQVTRHLVASFAEYTRGDLTNVLGKAQPGVGALLDALQATRDFEGAMERRFDKPFEEIAQGGSSLHVTTNTFTIASVFDSHFDVYVNAQDRAIADMLSQYRGSRSRSSLEGAMQESSDAPVPTVLPSSTELFYFYGQTLDQCGKYTTGEPMRKLAKVMAKWLKVYSDDVLLSSMKKTVDYGRRSFEGRFNVQEVKNACIVLNTAEYCQNTSVQLEERIKDRIDDNLKEDISFQTEREGFSSVMSTCITSILRELESASDPAFAAILKTPWIHLENVSGRSAYIVDLVGSIKQVAEVVRDRVEGKKYIRNFADKAVGLVMARFTQSVIKSRPLRKIGAEQILLDVQAVKACLLDLPEPHPENSTNAYTKYVTKHTGQLETMLKVILAPDDPPEGFVQNYCLLIGDRAFTNFQKILDLKGTPRADQQKLLDIFLSVTSTKDDLADTSFLTSLDMEPSADRLVTSPTSTTPALFSPTGGGSSTLPGLLARAASADGVDRSDTPKAFGDFRRLVSFATRGV